MSDLISRQAAMIVIENSGLDDDSKDTVVRVLEQLPSAQPKHDENPCQEQGDSDKFGVKTSETCDDCISRQAAIDLWDKYHYTIAVDAMRYDAELRQLPLVQPKRKTGKWKYTTHYGERYRVCPFCNAERKDDNSTGWYFCPSCGADMRQSSV